MVAMYLISDSIKHQSLHTVKWFNVEEDICLHTILMSIISIWHKDRTLSGATTPGQGEPGSKVNEGVLHVP